MEEEMPITDEDYAEIIEQQRQEEAQLPSIQEESIPWKMPLFGFVICLLFFAGADLLEIYTAGTIGTIAGWIVNGSFFFYTRKKSIPANRRRIIYEALIGDSIPFLDFLPTRTGMLLWFYITQ